ncbi:MAG: hypothetical protein ABI383_13065 [Acidobacteriaceae bacterium]
MQLCKFIAMEQYVVGVFATESVASEVLSGKRQLTVEHQTIGEEVSRFTCGVFRLMVLRLVLRF